MIRRTQLPRWVAAMVTGLGVLACAEPASQSDVSRPAARAAVDDSGAALPGGALARPGENHLRNIRQLTFGGTNAEAYFSHDGKRLVFQSTRPPFECDQIFMMNTDGSDLRLVSTGRGRTTCAFFLPGDERILYASTHLGRDDCPPPPDRSHGYVWAIYDSYDIFTARTDGSDLRQLTETPGYDAEATVSPDGTSIAFTSTRDGDLEIYTMDIDGSNVRRLTFEKGYDGGPFWSPDSRLICYRARHPQGEELTRYESLLARNLVAPQKVDLFVIARDGSDKRQLTHNEKANFCPYFHPSGKKLLFASNLGDEQGRNFDLYLINVDGTGLERVTTDPGYDFFPMFSPDGKELVFCASRNGTSPHELNVFIADWVD
ncbi:MAG: hypothetical protein AB1486_02530 [Planctomycetota bacterium]